MDFNLLENVHRLAFALNEGKYSALKVGIWLGAVISPPQTPAEMTAGMYAPSKSVLK